MKPKLILCFALALSGNCHELGNGPLACIMKRDMNLTPQSGRLIRPRLAGFEVTGDKLEPKARFPKSCTPSTYSSSAWKSIGRSAALPVAM
jgi:hypothetical protein